MSYDWEKECVQGDDGVWIFWPTENTGAYPAHLLRAIADYIDKLNAENK